MSCRADDIHTDEVMARALSATGHTYFRTKDNTTWYVNVEFTAVAHHMHRLTGSINWSHLTHRRGTFQIHYRPGNNDLACLLSNWNTDNFF